ncbi:MAG: tRNA pseudouridine(38-40) synthase TruA, partial [Gammaproteobacteria bacterium]
WQNQPNLSTIQSHVETALSRVANHPIQIVCAGRTDAGVHAIGQVIHFDTSAHRENHAWRLGANTYLPPDISLLWAKPVSDDFHARFSAISRRYQYIIYSRPTRPSIGRHHVTWDYRYFDIALMNEAAQYLIGKQDFTSYRGISCQAHTALRTITELLIIDICANAFLHHMVRNIAGVLMTIGAGEREPLWAKEVLEAHDRRAAGITAPPQGLYFVHVTYSEQI